MTPCCGSAQGPGLTAEQLKRRPVPPQSLSLLGLVRHMTEVERW
ncbi:MAG: mycothiol transferase [Acidimicrobiales bacterium]